MNNAIDSPIIRPPAARIYSRRTFADEILDLVALVCEAAAVVNEVIAIMEEHCRTSHGRPVLAALTISLNFYR